MWFCSECGKKNNGKFCTYCGTKYVEVDEEFTPSVPFGVTLSSDEPDDIFVRSENGEDEVFCASALFRKHCSDGNEEKDDVPEVAEAETAPAFPETSEITETAEAEVAETAETVAEVSEGNSFFFKAGELPEEVPVCDDPEEEEILDVCEEEPVFERKAPPTSPYLTEETAGRKVPFLRERDLDETENGSADFWRKEKPVESADDIATPEEAAAENNGVLGVFAHRHAPESEDEKVMRYGKRAIIAVGAVVGVICLAAMVMVGSLLISFSRDDTALPSSTGIYYYISGVEETTPLYADKSIRSDVLAELKNGDAVEYLDKINARFIFVYHEESEQYGYVLADDLVSDEAAVDYCDVENIYDDEKSLGYWYVTKTENGLNLWENPDGGGVVKAKLKNGFKVSVLEKTNDSYWYVFDYNSAERGYVRTAYLTDDKSKVVGIVKEPKDKTVIGDLFVTGVQNYLPIYAEPSTSAKVRGKLNNGDKVGLIQKTNSKFWYISANGVYGWVSANYLTATDPNPPAPTPEPTPPPVQDTSNDYKVYNTQEYLPVLGEPVVGGKEIAQIHNGDVVTFIKEYDDKFWYVKIPSLGIEGYVAKEYLTK